MVTISDMLLLVRVLHLISEVRVEITVNLSLPFGTFPVAGERRRPE